MKQIHLRLKDDTTLKLDALAKKEERSRNYMINKILEKHFYEVEKQKPQAPALIEPTPAEIARDFFATKEMWPLAAAKYQLPLEEVQKFVLYWTEPTKSGKKQRWETETTFEVQRRLVTWRGFFEKKKGKEKSVNENNF